MTLEGVLRYREVEAGGEPKRRLVESHATSMMRISMVKAPETSAFPSSLTDYKGAIRVDDNTRYGTLFGYFAKETLGVYGNSHRRFFHGPGLNSTDLAILRDIHLSESHVIQLRAESFNAFNHAQFSNPNGSINSSSFGLVTAAVNPRVYQFAAKYRF